MLWYPAGISSVLMWGINSMWHKFGDRRNPVSHMSEALADWRLMTISTLPKPDAGLMVDAGKANDVADSV